jgi:hypothetical protein
MFMPSGEQRKLCRKLESFLVRQMMHTDSLKMTDSIKITGGGSVSDDVLKQKAVRAQGRVEVDCDFHG